MIDNIIDGKWIQGKATEPIGGALICYKGNDGNHGAFYVLHSNGEWKGSNIITDTAGLSELVTIAMQREHDIIYLSRTPEGITNYAMTVLQKVRIQYSKLYEEVHN